MALSSLSVVTNANRLRRFAASGLDTDVTLGTSTPVVEVGRGDEEMEKQMFNRKKTITDSVCGMGVDPSTAAAHIDHAGQTYYFCSQHCADAFAADPSKYAAPAHTK